VRVLSELRDEMAQSKAVEPLYFFYQPCSVNFHSHTPTHWQFALKSFVGTFLSSLKMYTPLYLLTHVLNKKGLSYLIKKTIPNILRSSAFLATFGVLFAAIQCFLVTLTGRNYRIFAFAAAFIGAFLSILIEKPYRRQELAIYVLNQALETWYLMLMYRGLAPRIKKKYAILLVFSVAWAVLYTMLRHHPSALGSNIGGIMKFFVGSEERRTWLEKYILTKSMTPNTPLCKHDTTCVRYVVSGFIRGFVLGYGIKSLVALFPILLSPALLANRKRFLSRISKALGYKNILFGLFVALLAANGRAIQCLLRKVRKTDDALNTFVAGFFAGWAAYLSRSSEISGYVVAKSIETIFNYLVEKKKIKPLKHGELWLYSLCTATLFYASLYEPETLRRSYHAFLFNITGGRYTEYFESSRGLREEFHSPMWYAHGLIL
jgi:VanZ family protein